MKKRSENLIKGDDRKRGRHAATSSGRKVLAATVGRKGPKADVIREKPLLPTTETPPDESWDLPKLAELISLVVRRSGEDAWWIGMALRIARAKHKLERDWLRWLREEVQGLSKSTAYRYMDICGSFSLDEVRGKTINVLYKLMAVHEDDDLEEPAGDEDATHDTDEVLHDSHQDEPIIAETIGGKVSQAASERDSDTTAEVSLKPTAPPQPPVSAAEIDALAEFVEKIGGLTRAEYVFHAGVEQLRELQDEEG